MESHKILMLDDELTLSTMAEVISSDADVLQALADDEGLVSQAHAYLLSLNSSRSRQTMASFINTVAGMLGTSSIDTWRWGSLRRHHVMSITVLLHDTGRATATVITCLSALKGVAREA